MKRLGLEPAYRGLLTADTVGAVQRLERMTVERFPGVRLHVVVPPAGVWSPLSMRPTGREVHLRLALPENQVEALWSVALPCGFIPWMRHPVADPNGDSIFHFLGSTWQPLYDSFLAEGSGEIVWHSLCAAAQVDVGTWGGDRTVERFVQAQLHRLGVHCGPVDGLVGERTQGALAALGLKSADLTATAIQLSKMQPVAPAQALEGHCVIQATVPLQVMSSGNVGLQRTTRGWKAHVKGSGRIVLDFGVE